MITIIFCDNTYNSLYSDEILSIHIDTISIGLSIVCFKIKGSFFLNYDDVFLSLKVIVIVANSVNPDEMQHYAAFHLGLHCLPKYPL